MSARWVPALRIARRGVKRDRGRAVLVVALIGIPVGAATMVDVVARTLSSPERQAERDLGSADGAIIGDGDLDGLLPKGSRVVYAPASRIAGIARGADGVKMADPTGPSLPGTGHFVVQGQSRAAIVSADVRDPMHRQAATLKSGKAPVNDSQVLVSPRLAERLNLHLGGTITSNHGVLTITGIAEAPFCISCEQVVALPHGRPAVAGPLREGTRWLSTP